MGILCKPPGTESYGAAPLGELTGRDPVPCPPSSPAQKRAPDKCWQESRWALLQDQSCGLAGRSTEMPGEHRGAQEAGRGGGTHSWWRVLSVTPQRASLAQCSLLPRHMSDREGQGAGVGCRVENWAGESPGRTGPLPTPLLQQGSGQAG